MPKLLDKSICSGCAACVAACSKGAISMVADDEGFRYPKVDKHLCVKCGKCEAACPFRDVLGSRTPLQVFAAQAKNDELRMASSSGGVFSLFSRKVIASGGVVFGAAFDRTDWHVRHQSAETEEELADLRGSKYVQSDIAGAYLRAQGELKTGRRVLFSGTPCQIAGLKSYLGREYDNLLTVDIVCHGVPSPMVWQKYLNWQCEDASAGGRGSALAAGQSIRRIFFRRKNCGWRRFSLSLRFADGKEYLRCHDSDPFMQAFLHELCNRPSCHDCKCRELRSGSDLTIADFWGVEQYHSELDDDRGTSLLLVNTERGRISANDVLPDCDFCTSSYAVALSGNSAVIQSHQSHKNRAMFFKLLKKMRFDRAVRAALIGRCAEMKEFYYLSRPCLVNSLPMRIFRSIHRRLRK